MLVQTMDPSSSFWLRTAGSKGNAQRLLLVAMTAAASLQFALFHLMYEKHDDLSVRQLMSPRGESTVLQHSSMTTQERRLPNLTDHVSENYTSPLAAAVLPIQTYDRQIARSEEYARAFEPWPSHVPLPCFPPANRRKWHTPSTPPNTTDGFIFMKLMKTGGSTAAGIHLRIMRQIASDRNKKFDFCRGKFNHAWGYEVMSEKKVDPLKSFAWTVVREPTRRAISQFFHFEVSRGGVNPTDFNFQKYLHSEKRIIRHHYLQVLNSEKIYPPTKITKDVAPGVIRNIFNAYDFVGVTERMEESAVCLMMLLNLKMSTILYLNAKTNGAYDDGGHGQCSWIQPSVVSRGMKLYFREPHWEELVRWDEIFYDAANLSLDLTIQKLGQNKFEQNLAKFREARKVANEKCRGREVFPCTSTGAKNVHPDCLWKDSGCGVTCLDEVAAEMRLA